MKHLQTGDKRYYINNNIIVNIITIQKQSLNFVQRRPHLLKFQPFLKVFVRD